MKQARRIIIKPPVKATGVTPKAPPPKTQVALKVEATVESILRSIQSDLPDPAKNQIDRIAKLKDINGNLILNVKDRETIFQIVGMLDQMSLDDLEKYFLGITFSEDAIWNSPIFEKEQQKEFLDADIFLNRVKVKYGAECIYCKSKNVVSAEKQTRTADEGVSVANACQNCGKTWRS